MPEPTINALGDQAFELFNRGDIQDARKLYEKIYSLDASNAEAQAMLGVIKAETGDVTGAEKFLRQALLLDSEYADAHFYLGNV